MRKIVAFLLCSTIAFTLGLNLLPESFNLLVGWFGPIFGTSFQVLLAMIFILFGDPFMFTSLVFLWSIVGFVCGFIVRRRLGSFLTSLLVFFGMLFVIVIAGLRLFEIVNTLGIIQSPDKLLNLLPPAPPGASLGTILAAPVIGEIFGIMQGLSFTALPSPTEIMSVILVPIAFNLGKNLIILSLTALIGCEVGRFFEKIVEKKLLGKKGPQSAAEETKAKIKLINKTKHVRLSVLPFICILITSMLIFSLVTAADQEEPYYAEGIFGFVTPDGTAYLASAFVDSSITFSEIDLSSSEFEDALIGILLTQDTSASTLPPILTSPTMLGEMLPPDFPSEILENLTRYYELVPRTIYLTVYRTHENTARQKADIAVSEFSSTFGAPLSYLASFSQEIEVGGTKQTVTFLVYQSLTLLSDVALHIMDVLPLNRGGLTVPIDSAYRAGIFTPHETSISANGTVMAVGFFSSSIILDMIGLAEPGPMELLRMVLPNTTTPTPMLGLFSYWIDRLHSSSFLHSFNILELLNITESIQFSPEATISTIATLVPNATIEEGEITSQQPIISLVTSADLNQPEFQPVLEVIQSLNETVPVTLQTVDTGATIEIEDLDVGFQQVLPLQLKVVKTVTSKEVDMGQSITVNITINNLDEDSADEVILDDSLLFDYYNMSSIEIMEGNLTHRWLQIPGNSSKTHSYTILLKKAGIYTLPYAEVTYKYVNQTFSARSNSLYVNTRFPPPLLLLISGIPAAWNLLVRTINKIPGFEGKGSLVLSSITLIIVGLMAFSEFRNLKKWRSRVQNFKRLLKR